METVAFYSYKGGVGRSLLLVNTARFLALTGRKVVALDLDFEAPGLHYKLGVEGRVETGAVRLLQRSLDGDLPTLDDVRDAAIEVSMPATHGGWLRLVAAGPAPKGEYWVDLGRLHELLLANQDAGLLEAVLDLQARIEEAWDPDVLLVDARTGVTGLGGIATMALCDRVVLMTTRSRESLDGILAVAESLRATPTLRGGERRLEFVVSRVQGTEPVDEIELRELLGDYFELPHDSYDGGAERLAGDRFRPLLDGSRTKLPRIPNPEGSLLARTLVWASGLFSIPVEVADRERKRLMSVQRAWVDLTERTEGSGERIRPRPYWSPGMLATNVSFHSREGITRAADIVAKLPSGEIAMVIEYVDGETSAEVARWWYEHAETRVIVLLDHVGHSNEAWTRQQIYPGKGSGRALDSKSEFRWDLPSPEEFKLLPDPTDLSVKVLLEVARRSSFYDERLVAEWVRNAVPRDIGFAESIPGRAREILDGLAAIEDIQRAKEILSRCVMTASYRRAWVHVGDDYLDGVAQEGLCAPLCWRAPPLAMIHPLPVHWPAPAPASHALRRLARFMGLDYAPDTFRSDVSKLVGDDVHVAFQSQELDLKWYVPPQMLGSPSVDSPGSEQAPNFVGYHAHLGSYTPATARIVLAGPTIEAVAESLHRASRHVGSVTLLHLSVLGMLHNGVDLDGQRWEGFSIDPMPPATVALAQLFVHRFLLELDDEHLLDAFEALTDAQPPEYGAWRAMTHLSLEDARAWMMSLRRGTGAPAPIDLEGLLRSR